MADSTPPQPPSKPPPLRRYLGEGRAEEQAAPLPLARRPWHRRGLWWKLPLLAIVLLLIVVALLPTLLNTGAGRGVVLGQLNQRFNGRVDVNSWSLGWFSGLRVEGLRVFDAQNRQILEVKSLTTQATLLQLARGDLHLGKTLVDSPNPTLVINADGSNNFSQLVKSKPAKTSSAAPTPKPKTGEPTKLPNLTGDFEIAHGSGTVQLPAGQPPIYLTDLAVTATVTDINAAIPLSAKLTEKIGDGLPGSASVDGNVTIAQKNVLDLDALDGDLKATLQKIDAAGLAAFLASSGIDHFAGTADGQLSANFDHGKSSRVSAGLTVTKLAVGGPALKGDSFASESFKLDLPPTTLDTPSGLTNASTAAHVRIGYTVPAPGQPAAAARPLTVTFDQGSIALAADVGTDAIAAATALTPPASVQPAHARIDAKLDIGRLAQQLPHLVHLQNNVQLTGGQLTIGDTLDVDQNGAAFITATDLTGIAGTNAGRPVSIQAIHLKSALHRVPAADLIASLRDVSLELSSAFVNGSFTGKTISDLNGTVISDLAAAQAELGQIVDFGGAQLAGTLTVAVQSNGDASPSATEIMKHLNVTAKNVTLQRPGQPAIHQSLDALDLLAKINLGSAISPTIIDANQITLRTSDPQSPTVSADASLHAELPPANTSAGGWNVSAFRLANFSLDLAKLKQEVPALFSPAAANDSAVAGVIQATAAGSVQSAGGSTSAKLTDLTLADGDGTFAVQKVQGQDLTFANASAASQLPRVAGVLQVNADLPRLNHLVQAVTQQQPVATTSAGSVTAGTLAGTIALDRNDASRQGMNVNFTASNLAVTTAGGTQVPPQTVTLVLRGSAAGDGSDVSADTFTLRAPVVSIDGNAKAKLANPGGGTVATLDKLQSATLNIAVPDAAAAYALYSAIIPPTSIPQPDGTPLPPLAIIGGSLTANLAVSHASDGSLAVGLTNVNGQNIAFQRGSVSDAIGPIDLQTQLTVKRATTAAADAPLISQIDSVDVTQLGGKVGVASISMPTPLHLANLSGPINAAGAMQLAGNLEDLTKLLETLDAKPAGSVYPYQGQYVANQTFGSDGNTLHPRGDLTLASFKVLQNGQPVVSEDKLAMADDLVFDAAKKDMTINALTIAAQSSNAIKAAVGGAIRGYDAGRKFDNVTLSLDYDLAKLWPILKPIIAGDPGSMLAKTSMSGTVHKDFSITGALPADQAFADAIKQLNARGGIAVPQAQVEGGSSLAKLDVNISLANGTVQTSQASPATFNNGTLDIGNCSLLLASQHPRLSIPPNKKIIAGASVDPIFIKTVNGLLNLPIFSDPRAASGIFDLTCGYCQSLPIDTLVKSTDPANDGRAKFTYSLKNLDVTNQITDMVLQLVNQQEFGKSLTGSIQNGTVSVERGVCTTDTTLAFGKHGYPVQFAGGVGLARQNFQDFNVTLPPRLLALPDQAKPFLPQGISVPLRGTVSAPQADFAGVVQNAVAQAVAKGAVGDLLGAKKGNGSTTQPAASQPADEINNLLNQLGGDNKNKKKKKKQ